MRAFARCGFGCAQLLLAMLLICSTQAAKDHSLKLRSTLFPHLSSAPINIVQRLEDPMCDEKPSLRHCTKSPEELTAKVSSVMDKTSYSEKSTASTPFYSEFSEGGRNFGQTVLDSVLAIVGLAVNASGSEAIRNLNYNFYANHDFAGKSCSSAASGSGYHKGGGGPLCDLLLAQAGLGEKHIENFVVNSMGKENFGSGGLFGHDYKDNFVKSESLAKLVQYYGYSGFKDMMTKTGNSVATSDGDCVYLPGGFPGKEFDQLVNKSCVSTKELEKANSDFSFWEKHVDGDQQYYGLSGGGGAGAGVELVCAFTNHSGDKTEVTILTGGGGGGGGMTTGFVEVDTDGFFGPKTVTKAMAAGGGGGGGVQTPDPDNKGHQIEIGAGMGNRPSGQLNVNPASLDNVKPWVEGLDRVAQQIRDCYSGSRDSGTICAERGLLSHCDLQVRGGGGGGGGFEDLTADHDKNGAEEEVHPPALGMGYGFSFLASSRGTKPNDAQVVAETQVGAKRCGNGDISFTLCPGCGEECGPAATGRAGAAQAVDSPEVGIWPFSSDVAGKAFRCGAKAATVICNDATYVDPKSKKEVRYGEWANYGPCNCQLSRLYMSQMIPHTAQWAGMLDHQFCPGDPTPSDLALAATEANDGDQSDIPIIDAVNLYNTYKDSWLWKKWELKMGWANCPMFPEHPKPHSPSN